MRERLLKQKSVDYFVPMGRVKMKEWVLVTRKRSSDYLEYEDDFIEAIQFVLALSTKPPVKKPAKKPN